MTEAHIDDLLAALADHDHRYADEHCMGPDDLLPAEWNAWDLERGGRCIEFD